MPRSVDAARQFLAERIPALRDAPLTETRVCQYENTSNGDFLLDRHPEFANVWLAGGGSGHGFKHGPAVGAYLCARLLEGGAGEPRFSLAGKQETQRRIGVLKPGRYNCSHVSKCRPLVRGCDCLIRTNANHR